MENMIFKKVGLASDHAGKELKHVILDYLKLIEVEVTDYGVNLGTETSVDYPDYAELLAKDLTAENIDAAIAICGTGLGMAIAGNKFRGVRATPVWDDYSCKMSRQQTTLTVILAGEL